MSESIRFAWATDLHLDHVGSGERVSLGRRLAADRAHATLLSGDLSTASDVSEHLAQLTRELPGPVLFVLGNHDFYGGRIDAVRADMQARFGHLPLRYLHGEMELVEGVAVVGVDGWGDARVGEVDDNSLRLSDFEQIEDLQGLTGAGLRDALRRLGDQNARALRSGLERAMEVSERIVVLTHVPPFAEACASNYPDEGSSRRSRWFPYFVCDAVGQELRAAADARPDIQFLVLCGHTHAACEVQISPNLRVKSGFSEYGSPEAQPFVEFAGA